MNKITIESLAAEWEDAKNEERRATAMRRDAEDKLIQAMKLAKNMDGTVKEITQLYEIKVAGRLDHKIDSVKLQALAEESGLTEHLSSLFRWKPELNMTAWKAAHESITGPLLDAITTTASRPSFSITRKEN
ncbi:hypothetical protein UFOVP1355_2 [uncultured Caudovirales phage]|uniref:Uncharacterized protein n=1 Tax=uncultured Caudovirales phage TaxID=2100421 RepID=A0A6J5RZ07_9CAUD|nr:hypothetical protein UFOVP1355_2 [uncultured Caudovirales phage]